MSYFQRTPEAEEIAKKFKEIQQPKETKPPATDVGFVKPGGWGGDKLPSGWKITKMKDDPKLWKIVDAKGKNIATNFVTKEGAQRFIDVAKQLYNEDGDPTDPEPTDPQPEPGDPTTSDGPYKAIGKEMPSTTRGPTIRHYASGKPDDKTIEKNVKNIKFNHYQFLVDVKITTIEHNDTLSLKYGGTHMGSGWFDNSVDFETGLVGLGTEKKHPSADLNIVKGSKIGSIINKKIRVAGIYFKDQNKCEMWTNLGTGWKKGAEGVNVGGFNPKSEINEAQLRIDGFEAVPDITRAVVQEIA
jgi:hypothetical protein